ncbi:hypothetical protein WN943_014354 [Citrus x changshan-huyou]
MALAFEYLHHGRSTPMVHCDLKPSNNLLDEDMVAHVSDFNISKLLGEGEDSMTQNMTIATFGYMALGNAPRLIPNFVLFSRAALSPLEVGLRLTSIFFICIWSRKS